jgi:aerobic C4-dicarboxylate transport protein
MSTHASSPRVAPSRLRRTCGQLYIQVLGAVVLGALVGALWPSVGAELKPLGDAFIALIRMMIAPLIFCTVVTGIASVESMRSVGRIAGKALLYFELLTTFAMLLGLVVVKVVQPGAGMHIDPGSLSTAGLPPEATQPSEGIVAFLLGIIPDSFLSALTGGEILPVLLISVLFGFGLQAAGDTGVGVLRGVDNVSKVMFLLIRWIMRAAPIGAFGSMAYTIGKFGIGSLSHLGLLVGSFWLAALLFVFVGLGLVMRLNGLRLLPLLRYIREELLIVLGTSSSEPVLPRLMDKMQFLGASKPVVGITLPAGYSFNLDGTALYLTMGSGFLAQALGVDLSWGQWLGLLLVMMVSSKGAAGVTGSGFVALAATLSAVPHVPVAALALIFGIDRFMSEARALTSVVGNSVATIAVARWEGALDLDRARAVLAGREPASVETTSSTPAAPRLHPAPLTEASTG